MFILSITQGPTSRLQKEKLALAEAGNYVPNNRISPCTFLSLQPVDSFVIISLQYNGDVKAVDADGRTALAYARSIGADDCVKVMLANGCPDDGGDVNTNNSALRRTHGKNTMEKMQSSII